MAGIQLEKLGQILLREKKITEEELHKALEAQQTTQEKLGKLLVSLGYVSEDDLAQILSKQMGIPYLPLAEFSDTQPIGIRFNPKFIQQHRFFPLEMNGNELSVLMADPLDLATINAIKLASGCQIIRVYLGKESDINAAYERFYGSGTSTMEKIIEGISDADLQFASGEDSEDVEHLKDMAQEAPVIKLVNLLITKAIEGSASDIHVESFEDDLKVRYRIDGILYDTESPPKRLQSAIISRVKIMAKMNIAERRLPQDGRIRLRVMGKKIDLRVSTIPTIHGESVVMRILDRSSTLLELTDLGFPESTRQKFETLIRKPHGIVLVTGPTGSGKTTTLYAALCKLNSPDKKIITVEDPIEYQINGINQIQVKPKIGLTFSSGLRSIVRQDPDIMMVGEIRDLETAEIAIQSALTGHMVFSTLHTNDAPGAITRLLDMGVEHYLAASCLEGVLAQRLVRVICPSCKEKTLMEKQALTDMGFKVSNDITICKGRGCRECNFTGYRGRIGIYEMLVVNEEIRQLILEKTSASVIRHKALSQGMLTLLDDGWHKVMAGSTTLEEVLRVTQVEEITELASME
ncbi:MAG: type II secretion system ATPase GspE [Candidatus Schekmanbacteria bacterium]|nr:type II secretion system ATPase GspE [Candidatus Schekmanbacteria bacterium]